MYYANSTPSLFLAFFGAVAFTGPVSCQTNPELPDLPVFTSDAGALDVTMTTSVENGVQIGDQTIDGLNSLTVHCTTPGTACGETAGGPGITVYSGEVLRVQTNEALKISVENGIAVPPTGLAMAGHCMSTSAEWDPAVGWAPAENLFNLHTHGLLTSPYRHDDGTNVVLGDNIFGCSHGHGESLRYETLLGTSGTSDIPAGSPQPAGVNWFHPHVHGIAKAQVSSGMAGMIVTDGANYADENGNPIIWLRERNILLKDIQIVQPDAAGPWLNFADQDPDFCGDNKFGLSNIGSCPLGNPDIPGTVGASQDPMPGKWVFSLNGAVYPTITLTAPDLTDHRELWRVQNASANITYRLTLRPIGSDEVGPVLDAPFEVLSLDGGAAAGPTGGSAVAPLSREILLMPGARAELAVGRPDFGVPGADPATTLHYQLVNEAFQAGYGPDTADTWPRIAMAHVVFEGLPQMAMKVASRIELGPLVLAAPEMMSRSRSTKGTSALEAVPVATADQYDPAEIQQLCSDLSQIGFDPATTMRRIYFAIAEGDGAERFLLGETFVNVATGAEFDVNGLPVPPDGKVQLRTFDAQTGFCALRSSGADQAEVWELVNISAEVHNFHIHQMKFTPLRDGNGNVEMRAPSELDRVNLIDKLLLTSGNVELQHDTIIVPRGTDACVNSVTGAITQVSDASTDMHAPRVFAFGRAMSACKGDGRPGDQSGMLRINLAFAGDQFASYKEKPADTVMHPPSFVFHCHILEHEDNGMMARMTVLDPALTVAN